MKSVGYFLSIVSVFLLAAVSYQSASDKPGLLLMLVAGTATAIIGMALRWIVHRREARSSPGGG